MTDPNPEAGVDPATAAEEAVEARSTHDADRPPTEEEARRAEAQTPDPAVADHAEEMNKIGADVKGEGEIS